MASRAFMARFNGAFSTCARSASAQRPLQQIAQSADDLGEVDRPWRKRLPPRKSQKALCQLGAAVGRAEKSGNQRLLFLVRISEQFRIALG